MHSPVLTCYYNTMIKILKILLDFIYNRSCYFCNNSREDTVFCQKCYKSVEFLPFRHYSFIGKNKLYSASCYDGIVKKLIRAVKFHNKTELADFQAKLMYDYWESIGESEREYTVVPVPMFFSKARKRKYNHMDLVGEKFCELTGYKLNKTSLIRNRETQPQFKLSVKEREKNLKDAFSVVDKNIKEPVLLIDDISTTGTTLKEIIKALNSNNIYDITCFVTSIADRKSN